jgi:DNA-binding MarR family transcriptional regulator
MTTNLKLTPAQMKTLEAIKNAPLATGNELYWMTYKNEDGTVHGKFTNGTIKALAKKGLIEIIEVGSNWSQTDLVRLIEG